MADWTTIPDASLEPGKPIRSVDGLALRDNPVAIAEGAAGAPRVQMAALQGPTAGDAYLIFPWGDGTHTTDTTSYVSAGDVVIQLPGVARVKVDHASAGTGGSSVKITKNGVTVQEWSLSGTPINTFYTRTVDVSVTTGDVIGFWHKRDGANSSVKNRRVYSGAPTLMLTAPTYLIQN